MYRIGIDVGGTFTDVILHEADGRVRVHKLLSTPPSYDRAVVEAVSGQPLDAFCAERIFEPLGIRDFWLGLPAQADGNTTSLFTATLDGLGPVGDGAHATHEFLFLDEGHRRPSYFIVDLLRLALAHIGRYLRVAAAVTAQGNLHSASR